MENHIKPRRETITYGRQIQVKLGYRETTGGSSVWGPWKEVALIPARKTFAGKKIVEWMINHGWIKWGDLVYWAFFKHMEDFGKENENGREV